MKSALRSAKNLTKGYSEIQIKVRDATSNDANAAAQQLLLTITDATYSHREFLEIFYILDKRLNDHGKNWRHVFKTLVLLDYLLRHGSDSVVDYCKENVFVIKTLKEFQYVDEDGRDQGLNGPAFRLFFFNKIVRQKSKEVTAFIMDEEKLKQERLKNKAGDANSRPQLPARMNESNGNPSNSQQNDAAYYNENSELQKALEESKRTADEDERRRLQLQQSEEDLEDAINQSRKEEKDKSSEKDQIDFFSTVDTYNPQINVINPYNTGITSHSLNPYGQSQQFQPDFAMQQQMQYQAQQQQMQYQAQQELLAQEQYQTRQNLLAQQQYQAQQEFLAQQQYQSQQELQAHQALNVSLNNPFGKANTNNNTFNFVDHEVYMPEFNKTNATIDPFASVATKKTAETLSSSNNTSNPFGAAPASQIYNHTVFKTEAMKNSPSQSIRNYQMDDLLSLDPISSTYSPMHVDQSIQPSLNVQFTGTSIKSGYSVGGNGGMNHNTTGGMSNNSMVFQQNNGAVNFPNRSGNNSAVFQNNTGGSMNQSHAGSTIFGMKSQNNTMFQNNTGGSMNQSLTGSAIFGVKNQNSMTFQNTGGSSKSQQQTVSGSNVQNGVDLSGSGNWGVGPNKNPFATKPPLPTLKEIQGGSEVFSQQQRNPQPFNSMNQNAFGGL